MPSLSQLPAVRRSHYNEVSDLCQSVSSSSRLTAVQLRKVEYQFLIIYYTGLFEMIVGFLATCHTQYT